MDGNIKVQIYEIQEPKEAEALIVIGVDHIGSVLLEESRWKQPALADTTRVVADSPARSSLIPLFSSADVISQALDFYRPDLVHFCEAISVAPKNKEYLDNTVMTQKIVRQRFPEIEMMRSLPVGLPEENDTEALIALLSIFEPISDWFLTDTVFSAENDRQGAAQPVTGFIGITGETGDWGAVAQLIERTQVPVILAGGLSPENVYDGVMGVGPAGVDSCTRTNADDGRGGYVRFKKDLDKVARFVRETRRAEGDSTTISDPREEIIQNNKAEGA